MDSLEYTAFWLANYIRMRHRDHRLADDIFKILNDLRAAMPGETSDSVLAVNQDDGPKTIGEKYLMPIGRAYEHRTQKLDREQQARAATRRRT